MIESLKARVFIVCLVTILAIVWLIPNFTTIDEESLWPSKDHIVYGLDIQGGLHMVLEADINEVIQERLNRVGLSLKEKLEQEKVKNSSFSVSSKPPYYLTFKTKNKEAFEKLLSRSDYSTYLQVLKETDQGFTMAYFETRVKSLKTQVIDQTIEVIRNRIDEFGVSEPLISTQGEERILIQLPGIKDSAQAKELIQRTAKLEFAVVNEEFPPDKIQALITKAEKRGKYSLGDNGLTYRDYIKKINQDLKRHLKPNEIVVFERAPSSANLLSGRIPYVVDTSSGLQGSHLEDATVAFDSENFNRPEVRFKFQPEGRRIFAELTGSIVGRKLAVILDRVLKSAPVVQGKIHDNPRISLGAGNYDTLIEEANMIATSLRAGSLPANLKQLEEKTVGPTLGKDSIKKGQTAGTIGLILVILFMFSYYRTLGVIANVSLVMNMAFLLALLSSLSATLTLPGVAGIILTIGMAVDANVIIFERIKEEFRKGASLKLAIKDGFGNAFSAILDANITTAIVCLVLIYFGTGPIRGFAVTLFCGIITSLFTAIFLSRTLLDLFVLKLGWKKI